MLAKVLAVGAGPGGGDNPAGSTRAPGANDWQRRGWLGRPRRTQDKSNSLTAGCRILPLLLADQTRRLLRLRLQLGRVGLEARSRPGYPATPAAGKAQSNLKHQVKE